MNQQELRSLWDFADPGASEARFRAALAALDADGEVTAPEVETQIARASGLQRDFAGGHAILDSLDVTSEAPRVSVRMELERGRLFNSAGDPERARPHFERAYEVAAAIGEEALAIDAAHMIAIVAPPEEQLEWNRRALALAERSADPVAKAWAGSLLNNLGWTYHDRGEFEVALDHFRRAAAWRRDAGQVRETRIADWAVARALRSLSRLDEALPIHERLRAEWDAAGEPDPYVFEELAECLLALGRTEDARAWFRAALEGLSADPWLVQHEPDRLERLRQFASQE